MNIKSKITAILLAASSIGLVGVTHADVLGIKKYLIQTAPVKGNFKSPEQQAGNKAASIKAVPCSNKNLKISMNDMPDQKDTARSGAIITIQNISKQACAIQGRPDISFLGLWHIKENIAQQIPRGFMPGPVILPRTLQANDTASMRLQWLAKDVSGKGSCKHPRKIKMTTSGVKWIADIKASICAEEQQPVTFSQSSFQVKGQPDLP